MEYEAYLKNRGNSPNTCLLYTSPAMAGENFYTDRELAEKLKVSRRSLQQYRDSGRCV